MIWREEKAVCREEKIFKKKTLNGFEEWNQEIQNIK